MRTMNDIKRCGSLRSMRHLNTRPYEDKSVPHLALYVQHMNKTKLLKEREAVKNRMAELDNQIRDIDSHILNLRPKLGFPEARKCARRKKGEIPEKRRINKMKLSF